MTHRLFGLALATAAVAAAVATPAAADEVDDLVARLKPPARYRDHKPAFSVHKETFTFEHLNGPHEEPFWLVMDGDRYVAAMPLEGFHSGTIYVQDFRPDHAPKALDFPTERWHIDTAVGTELRTNNFIPEAEGATDATYDFTVADGTLTLVRRYKGTTKFNRWAHRTKEPVRVDAVNTIVFRCDPVLGYVVEATFDTWTDPPPKNYEYTSAATSGRYLLWPGQVTCHRHAITPPGGGYKGYACNHGSTKPYGGRVGCRDGGFVAFLNDETGWSPTTTIEGADARLIVCGAHTDHDFVVRWPEQPETRADGLKHNVMKHRILALPPELTRHVWDHTEVLGAGERKLMVRFGRLEDFEDQPLPVDGRERGMPWGADLTEQEAHSGTKAVVVSGVSGHGDPQIALQPDTHYRLEAWMKVVAWTDAEKQEAVAKARAEIEKQRQKGRDVPDFQGLEPPQAYLVGRYYEWTPHSGQWIGEPLQTNVLEPGGPWQKVNVDFTTPKWGPFIDLKIVARNCTAYVDDFQFVVVKEAE